MVKINLSILVFSPTIYLATLKAYKKFEDPGSHKIWHASDFIQNFSKRRNSRKGDNSEIKKTTCVSFFSMRNPYARFLTKHARMHAQPETNMLPQLLSWGYNNTISILITVDSQPFPLTAPFMMKHIFGKCLLFLFLMASKIDLLIMFVSTHPIQILL